MTPDMDVRRIQEILRQFAEERDWEQFHSPKNLAMALACESGELLEVFQWLTEDQSASLKETDKAHRAAAEEIADVGIYLIRLADRLGVDLEKEILKKIELNRKRYPADLARGRADKASELGNE